MKKTLISITAAALALLTAFALAGCGKSVETPSGGDVNVAVSTPQAPNANTTSDPNGNRKDAPAKENTDTRKHTTPAPEGAGAADIGSDLKKTVLTVKSEDCFEGYGFYMFIAGADAEYSVVMNQGGGAVEWEVYVLPDKFEDAERYIPNSYSPALTDSGTLTVEKNSYIYVHCSVNSFTSESPAEGASVTFTGYGVPEN